MNNVNKYIKISFANNVFLTLIKLFFGYISKSKTLIADGVHCASDMLTDIIGYIGNIISSKKPDVNHPFGHGKAEYIFSLFISISMIFVSIKTIIDACKSLINGSELKFSWWLVVVCIATIITKLCLYIYVKLSYKKCKNILLQASMEDHRNDCIITTFTLISVLLSLKGIQWFDGIVGIGISAWICKTGIEIFIESYNILMDRSIDETTKDTILNVLHTYKEIKSINDISSAPVGYQYVLFLTIAVDGNMTTFQSHKLADKLEKDMTKLDNVYKAIIHIEPYLKETK